MNINIEITGVTPLLMNRFNIEENESKIKEKDLTPREVAYKKAYLDGNNKLIYPTANIFSCIIAAGVFHKYGKVKITTARSSLIPAGLMMQDGYIYFKEPVEWEVDTRRVVVPSTGGAIPCHRPRLDKWSLEFNLELDVKMFSPNLVRTIVDDAGQKIGLGDYRPSRKGIYGRFVVTKWIEEKIRVK